MKIQENVLSIGKQIFLGKTIVGASWILAGVFGYIGGLLGDIFQAVFLLGAILPMLKLWRSKKEESDEMADDNYIQAKAKAGDLMHIVLCLATIAVPLISLIPDSESWNWPRVMAWSFFILIGIQNLITGFVFKRLEEE